MGHNEIIRTRSLRSKLSSIETIINSIRNPTKVPIKKYIVKENASGVISYIRIEGGGVSVKSLS